MLKSRRLGKGRGSAKARRQIVFGRRSWRSMMVSSVQQLY
jgi:hypothetical protein